MKLFAMFLFLASTAFAANPSCRITGCTEAELSALCGNDPAGVSCPVPVCPTPVCPVPVCPAVAAAPVTFTIQTCGKCVTKASGRQVCHRCTVKVP
jgi:hypothetical protein